MGTSASCIKQIVLLALSALLLSALAVSCGTDDNDNGQQDAAVQQDSAVQQDAAVTQDGGGFVGHTLLLGGHWHMPGNDDPLTNCTSCHGSTLQGGAGPSCYDCHDNSDHTIIRGGHSHRSGSDSSCNACHGPNNTGGLGPACTECH